MGYRARIMEKPFKMNWRYKLLNDFVFPAGDRVFRSQVMKKLNFWREVSQMSEEELISLQNKNLHNLLSFATKNVSFYKKYMFFMNEDSVAWLKHLPIMKKNDIKHNIDTLVYSNKCKLIKKVTSGSSGVQGITYMSKEEQDYNRAIQLLWMEWAGWKMGDPILQTGMTIRRGLLKKLKDILLRTDYYSAFGLSEKDSIDTLKKYQNKKNYFIGGYASSLYVLAKIAEKNNMNDIRFKGAISWGDKMFPHFRKDIKSIFGCDVTDTYGCSEGLNIACQKDLPYYYIMSPYIFLELLDSNGEDVKDGEPGYVVVTRLDSRSMPLIRYYTGDLAIKLPKENYPTSRQFQFPLLEKVVGRDTDIVHTRSGQYLIVHYFTGIFEFVSEIKQFRVVQETLDGIIIEYIKGDNFDVSILVSLEKTIKQNIRGEFKISWKEVNNIPPTKSGKPQIVKSYIGNQL